ncbi:MAG: hypothetical protein RL336_317 [Pseudomonadota bacterium]
MTHGNSKIVSSNQLGPHDNLAATVRRHMIHPSRKPFSQHTLEAFAEAQQWLSERVGDIILDSCCGTGESTAHLASMFPDARVIGVDKSIHRLERHQQTADNYLLLQADLNDFWRLAKQSGWKLSQHYLLYPNPYPKSVHYKRRWHASPALPYIVALGGELTVRSNWKLYIDEFVQALGIYNIATATVPYRADHAVTAFERKYWASGQSSWQLHASLDNFCS